jgi:hypothetical protein
MKAFFGAKDILPTVDYGYVELLNQRLFEIMEKINTLVHEDIRIDDIEKFRTDTIVNVFNTLKDNNLIARLNNQWRRTEDVYFSWMRGFIMASYFMKSLSLIFDIDIKDISLIWDDDLSSIDTFRRSPKADLQLELKDGSKLRIEVQSGFQDVNDIKQHKVIEAKRIKQEEGIPSLVIHFDLFNGQVAFVDIDSIDDDSINWITRQQMEWQTVFNINQNLFAWKLTEKPPKFNELLLD